MLADVLYGLIRNLRENFEGLREESLYKACVTRNSQYDAVFSAMTVALTENSNRPEDYSIGFIIDYMHIYPE